MKRFILLATIAVTGCNTSVTPAAKGEASTLDLLAEGSADVCNREDVRTTLLSEIKPTIRPVGDQISQDIEGGMSLVTYSFDTIALAGVDKAIKSVSCDANLTVKYKDHEDRTFQVRYTIRPSVEDKQAFVINTVAPEAMQYAKAATEDAVTSVVGDRLRNSQREEEPEAAPVEEDNPTTDATTNSQGADQPQADAVPMPPDNS